MPLLGLAIYLPSSRTIFLNKNYSSSSFNSITHTKLNNTLFYNFLENIYPKPFQFKNSMEVGGSVTRFCDLLDFGPLFKAIGSNSCTQI